MESAERKIADSYGVKLHRENSTLGEFEEIGDVAALLHDLVVDLFVSEIVEVFMD
jgi:hypothetical protein